MFVQSSAEQRTNTASASVSDIDNDKVCDQVHQILIWLDEHPEINVCKDLKNLTLFLRSCKYDIERTKEKISVFCQMRVERTEWFANRDPYLPKMQQLLSIGVLLPIDGVDEENRKVIVIRTAAHDPKCHSLNDFLKVSKMVIDLLLKIEPDNCMNGIAAIFDMQGVTTGHALQLTPKLIKHSVETWQAYPCTPKLLEFVNAPRYVNLFLNTFRYFMTPKMRSRVYVQNQNTTVKCDNLPIELRKDGNGPSYKILANKWKQLVQSNAAFFIENQPNTNP